MNQKLYIHKLNPNARLPVRSTTHAAGYDIYALGDHSIPPGEKVVIPTGIALRIPSSPIPGTCVYGSVRSRSGLSFRDSIEVGAGVIDEDFSGELNVILYNHSKLTTKKIYEHERIAQLVLELHITPIVEQVDELPDIETNRIGGFGSTGN